MTRTIATIALFALIPACAHRDAESLARENLLHVVEYESALQRTAVAANEYYENSVGDLRGAFENAYGPEDDAQRNVLAADAADDAIRNGVSAKLIRDFVESGVTQRNDSEQRQRDRLSALEVEMKGFLGGLDIQQKKLNSLKGKLERLQTRRSNKNILKELRPLVEAARCGYMAARDVPTDAATSVAAENKCPAPDSSDE